MCLLLVTTAIALASSTAPTAPRGVAAAVGTINRDRRVLRFFAHHRWLLHDPRFAAEAKRQIALHRRSLRRNERLLEGHRRSQRQRLARRLAAARVETSGETICRVFGDYCAEALSVARCESRLQTTARNGEYLGLFQMSRLARRLFGHGDSAQEQARAALRYFVSSGRDWSPWSCRPR